MMPDGVELSPQLFGEFYTELYPGRTPYRWHERLARELADGDAWSDGAPWEALSAPTGSGKTTLIECFLFALACAGRDARLPRRLFWVVDRRNVVDQVYLHAHQVAESISSASDGGLVAAVRARLQALAPSTETAEAVQVRLWRGGLAGEATADVLLADADRSGEAEEGEAGPRALLSSERLRGPLSPVAAAIVCSTVDQVGSRLLFRGYGVSRRSRPIEAALVGTDSLIVLDEAHLSSAFQETATAIAEMQRAPMHRPPVRVLAVTATHRRPTSSDLAQTCHDRTFELTPAERDDPALAQPMAAERPVTLMRSRDPAATCSDAARELADEGHRVIGIVANTVAGARRIADALRAHGEIVLIIGPSRPLDRARLLDRIPNRDRREQLDRPLFVIGTQTLEVGLDIDFDALATECAPLPSIVQRFGRLDRAGILTLRKEPGRGVVVQPPKQCPVYGEATAATWQYLCDRSEQASLNLGAEQTAQLLTDPDAKACEIAQPESPLLRPCDVELLAQTSHVPVTDPNVAVLLRGKPALEQADVNVCWRADLTGEPSGAWVGRVAARPPHPGEMLSLSRRAARRWLSNPGGAHAARAAGEIPDVEGIDTDDGEGAAEDGPAPAHEPPSVVRVPPADGDGEISPEVISALDVRAGDVIVLPSHIGGCDEFGWNPSSRVTVTDLGNLSQSRARLLLSARVGTPQELLDKAAETLQLMAREEISGEEAYETLREPTIQWLAHTHADADSRTPAAEAALWLSGNLGARGNAIRLAEQDGDEPTEIVLAARRDRRHRPNAAVPYDEHAAEVERRVGAFAERLGLPSGLTMTLQTAARHHDVGKRDRRFQAWLNGGQVRDPARPLAKSERGPGAPLSWVARTDSGWPRGKRHEALSAALLDSVRSWPADVDRDLLLYIVSTHHGDGRPFRWFAADLQPVRVAVDIEDSEASVYSDMEIPWHEHAHRFAALNERYGAWGLAAIESLLVLADRAVSAEGL